MNARSFFLLSLLFFHNALSAKIISIELTLSGIACPYCIGGVEDILKNIPGVEEASCQSLKNGIFEVTWNNQRPFVKKQFDEAFQGSSFAIKECLIEITGKIEKNQSSSDLSIFSPEDQSRYTIINPNQSLVIGKSFKITGIVDQETIRMTAIEPSREA